MQQGASSQPDGMLVRIGAVSIHALLIGIDGYEERALRGCVNDIDAIADLLIAKLGVPAASIRRLISPHPGSGRAVSAAEPVPTYENIVAALRALAQAPVQAGDRVFIYYSGHGSYTRIPEADSYFEGLVPLDYATAGLLFDFELNELLQAIAERCHDLTVVLDCCHSAGATRELPSQLEEGRARFLPLVSDDGSTGPAPLPRTPDRRPPEHRREPQEYTVVAACQTSEVAAECRSPGLGRPHGLLTASLLELLQAMEPAALDRVRWCDIWESLRAQVRQSAPQHPQLLGPKARRVFGGPWQRQDSGYAVTRGAGGSYRVAAGSLAGIGPGAELAVYGPEPPCIPPRDSVEERRARIGTLCVDTVELAQATAWPVPYTAQFAIQDGVRARLVKPGEPDRLRVALNDEVDDAVKRLVVQEQASGWYRFVPAGDPRAEARVGQYASRDLWIGDDTYGPGEPSEQGDPGPLGLLRWSEARSPERMACAVRAALNHYAQFVIPLRIHRSGGFTLPQQSIALRVLDCADEATGLRIEQHAELRRELRRDVRGRYRVDDGARIAIEVRNTLASVDLYVSLLYCSLEGQLQVLNQKVLVRADSSQLLWECDVVGHPFLLSLQADELSSRRGDARSWGIDRLVVIASSEPDLDLSPLQQEQSMNQVIDDVLLRRAVPGRVTPARVSGSSFTAAQVSIQIGIPASSRHALK